MRKRIELAIGFGLALLISCPIVFHAASEARFKTMREYYDEFFELLAKVLRNPLMAELINDNLIVQVERLNRSFEAARPEIKPLIYAQIAGLNLLLAANIRYFGGYRESLEDAFAQATPKKDEIIKVMEELYEIGLRTNNKE